MENALLCREPLKPTLTRVRLTIKVYDGIVHASFVHVHSDTPTPGACGTLPRADGSLDRLAPSLITFHFVN